MRNKTTLSILNIALLCFACPAADVAKDYHDQDLKERDFSNASLNGANFSDAILSSAKFNKASLKKANFKGADLTGTSFPDADLTEADLRETTLKGYCSYTNFSKANFEGITLQFGYGCKYRGANLKKCKISGQGDHNMDGSGADLRGANLRAVTTLSLARWKGALYDEDTAFPDGFDPAAAGMVLAKPEPKKDTRADTDDKK
jgi:uncharacterized protein YjbI with pentapeptide repeats